MREAIDAFLDGLIWNANPADDPALTGGGGFFPPATDRGLLRVLLVCPPEAVTGKAHAWKRAVPHLDVLREPFAAAGMNVNIWDVNNAIQHLVRSGEQIDRDRLADPDSPLELLTAG